MQNRAYDEFDEYSEGYLVEVTKEQEEELNNLINAKEISREEFFKEHYGEKDEN